MNNWLISNARLINEGQILEGDLRICRGRIEQIGAGLKGRARETQLDARGRYLMPGMIDGQVHFREPGLTRQADMVSESRAAVAGGVTSYLDMPDTRPATTSARTLAEKFSRASGRSTANYSFYLGASRNNIDEIRRAAHSQACGVQVSMSGSDELLVEDLETLATIFRDCPLPVAVHCEDNTILAENLSAARKRHGKSIPARSHATIRSREACLSASRQAVGLAREHGTRLHVLNLSTAGELALFEPGPIADKQITAEACVSHLYFIEDDHDELGNLIKCNPSIKSDTDRRALRQALAGDRLDTIATGHAPHLLAEKTIGYLDAAAGMPLVQFALPVAWALVASRMLRPEKLVEKLAHNPAQRFNIRDRGFLREGYHADLVLVDPNKRIDINQQAILSKCSWSPLAGRRLPARVAATWVNGRLVWREGLLTGLVAGEPLSFQR